MEEIKKNNKVKPLKILLAGGGSGGPVAPLLAVAQVLKKLKPSFQFFLVGTNQGPERQMAAEAGIDFTSITTGKWRRYWSLKNLFAPFLTLLGLLQAFSVLRRFKPDCIFGAGSFVQVPVIWVGSLLGIPSVIHQQDVEVSLANRLCEFFAKKITVCFEKSLTDFSSGWGIFYKTKQTQKIELTGNPFRQELKEQTKEKALKLLGLHSNLPVLLVLGGRTGSDFINKLILKSLPLFSHTVQIVHSWGLRSPKAQSQSNYRSFGFISDMASAYAASDIVLSRAGLSTLTELSNLSKLSIIIPMPNTHQEYNAFLLKEFKAALVFEQTEMRPQVLIQAIKKALFDFSLQKQLSSNISKIMPKNSDEKIAQIIMNLVEKNGKK